MPPKQDKKRDNPFTKLFGDLDEHIANSVKRDELVEALRDTIKLINDVEERTTSLTKRERDALKSELSQVALAIRTVENSLRESMKDMGEQGGVSLGQAIKELKGELSDIRSLIPTLPDYTDLFNGIESRLSQIRPDTAEEIRNKLELFVEEDEKLKIDAIGYLREELDELKKMEVNMSGGGNGLAFREFVTKYDLSPYLDGVTKTFNIPGTYAILSVACSSFPSVLRPTIDYTHTQTAITFTDEITADTTLASGQTVIIMLINA